MNKLIVVALALISFSVSAEKNTIEVNGYNIEYELSGHGDVTLLLEAGGSAGLEDWEPIYYKLTKTFQVLRYSRVGNGNSSKVRKNYSSDEYAAEALELIDKLDISDQVIYIAHSYGAYIARIFAAKYPEKVAALMLIEPASEHDVDIMRKINLDLAEKQIAQIKLDDLKNGMSNQYLDFWAKRPLPDYPEIGDIPVTVITSVKKFKKPSILFFTDEGRQMWGKLHTEWAESFPQGKIVLTSNSYHFPHKDEPEMILKQISALVNRTLVH